MTNVPQIDIDWVVGCIKQGVRRSSNEEEVRIGVSRCIEDGILRPLGIGWDSRYEYRVVSGGRVDALYGHVVVEFKAPGRLSSASDIAKAMEQLVRYITNLSERKDRYLGVIISDRIAFVRYYKPQNRWILRGPYEITRETIIKLIEALRGLRRKALVVEALLKDFGPQSDVARETISILYRKLVKPTNPRTELLFKDWMRLFKQATGYEASGLRDLPKMAREYGISGDLKYDALIFAIQTYYAYVMKLLAAEVVYLYGAGRLYKSYIAELEDRYAARGVHGLREILEELESGGIFRKFGYENFLEGDYFSWYLGELDEELADVLAKIARRLADYEPATPQLEPEYARDLLKRLYQHLLPRDIRHNLGEYYTPDWLADMLLDEVGLSLRDLEERGREDPLLPLRIRVLDPACGSGTFLVRYIARLRTYAREHYLEDVLVDHILNNVVGYDLNPLAVLAARTNYLLMIADLPKRGIVEIPIYLADSLMVERRSTLTGSMYVLKTVAGEFQIPARLVDENMLPEILSRVATALESKDRPEEFRDMLKQLYSNLTGGELTTVANFYARLFQLEREGKNDVWIAIIRNAFAPMLKGKFDYVVGNPPWVRWENLPENYREATAHLWDQYGIVGQGAGFKRDLSMLFFARCYDLYLRPGGKLAFLMPFTVLKSQAGSGFRKFLITKTKIQVVHDLVSTRPFEGAVNKASAIVVEKPCELEEIKDMGRCKAASELIEGNKIIKHVIWISERAIPTDSQLNEVENMAKKYDALLVPLKKDDLTSPWIQVTSKIFPFIERILGFSPYEAHSGVYTSLNQVYYIDIVGKDPSGKLIVENPPESGQKKHVEQIKALLEPELVYPLVRGRDVRRWYVRPSGKYVILPHDPENGRPFSKRELRQKYPATYEYLSHFKEVLKTRSIKPFQSLKRSLKSGSKSERRALAKLEEIFYIVDNIGSYTFTPYKVVWKEVSARMSAGGFHVAVIEPIKDVNLGEKVVVPDHTVILIPLYDRDEAYYLAGILNSTIMEFIGTYFVTTSLQNINIPKFDANNDLHKEIASLSEKAHELAKCIFEKRCGKEAENTLRDLEKALDNAVAKLYNIPEDVLEDMRKLLNILKMEETTNDADED